MKKSIKLTLNNVLEGLDGPVCLIDIVQARHLNEPANIMREQLVPHDPFGELIPLARRSTVNA